jgi:hypothetical protein
MPFREALVFHRLFFGRKAKGSGTTIDELQDQAVAAWISTFPRDARLEEFLARVPAVDREEIRCSCRAIFDAAGQFLEECAARERLDIPKFHAALREYLQPRFPWMGEAAFNALSSYTSWYAWHEGY